MKFIGIIPARFASSRFPGKPLVEIFGKSMIQRVYEQSKLVIDHVVVATDDERIATEVKRFGGEVIMTSDKHQSGTDRCAEAARVLNTEDAVIVNIQGDEPFIQPQQIKLLMDCFADPNTEIATLIKPTKKGEDIFNPDKPKVVINNKKQALYFSRSPIPYIRNHTTDEWLATHQFFNHIGIYAYRNSVLQAITKLEMSALENAEKLEQNRWLENGYSIHVNITELETVAIDTPEDLERLLNSPTF